MSTPLLLPLAQRERIKVTSFWQGSLRVRVKSLGDLLNLGSIFFGIRSRKLEAITAIWHGFSRQDLCHLGQLLRGFLLAT
jgi:hypothetical protein